jgi:hypothetical protein
MTHRTDFPEHETARATNLNGDILIYMPWCYFRDPVSTLQQQTEDGGMDLIDITAKFPQLFLQNVGPKNRSETLAAEWLNVWAPLTPKTKPSSPRSHVSSLGSRNKNAFVFMNARAWNPRGRTKQGGLLNEGNIAPCELCLLR